MHEANKYFGGLTGKLEQPNRMFAELIRDVEAHPTRINLSNVAVCTQMLDKINNVPFRLTISYRKNLPGLL